ncbi:MAG: ATP-binding protein [Candidatus Undinarchaeales archaeon]|jgi:DNA helicase HerA-like ATPase|nr:ATP-binding protein [Candidatus Undinarchaeales archaeon]
MNKVGSVDFFDGNKRKMYFFVENENIVEEEGFYKVETDDKIFYIFVTNLEERPIDSDIGSRVNREDFAYDLGERYILYAQASVLLEYRKKNNTKVIGYKTIPRHGNSVYELEDIDFEKDRLGLPRLDFAHVRSGSQKLDTKVGFKKDSYITHWLLSGWTCSGKTNAAKVLLGVTIKGDENGSFAGGVIIDPHGEYYEGLKVLNSASQTKVVHLTINPDRSDKNAQSLSIPLALLTPNDLCEVRNFNPETQKPFMWRCRSYFWKVQKGEVSDDTQILSRSKNWVEMIINEDPDKFLPKLGSDYGDSAGRKVMDAVKRRLRSIIKDDDLIWGREYTPILKEIKEGVARGLWYVIDVSSISNNTAKLITSLIANELFKDYKGMCINNKAEWKKYKPAGILVEEAHNYLSSEEASKGNIIAKIAKEGRKFKVFTIVVEQDPSGIDERVLKQIHNKITLQLIPKDARALCDTTPYIGELEKKIPYYEPGEGVFVSTGSFNFALPVKFPMMKDWVASNAGKCVKCKKNPVVDAGLCSECGKNQKAKDAEAFM